MKISIVMPVYNSEQFLGKALDSILAQSFQDFELILVDDCSKDGSPQFVTNMPEEITVSRFIIQTKMVEYVRLEI